MNVVDVVKRIGTLTHNVLFPKETFGNNTNQHITDKL